MIKVTEMRQPLVYVSIVAIGGGSIYKVGGPDAKRRRCQRDGGRSERTGQKPLSTFHLEVVNFVYFGGHFDKFVFPG